MSFSAGKLAAEITKYVKDFKCIYAPDWRQKIADSWPMSIDDTPARNDWDWKPEYDIQSMTKDMIEKLFKKVERGTLFLPKGSD
jgi:nucleoside-diphosphate-sugar epimerase